ncbi:hypothetical protein GCM10010129_22290 [Streptomyces fumigatiscleroticus]|nr:hypothetical protein GCM10010129_22290 [Streptomyces fumigatiscleroticus]
MSGLDAGAGERAGGAGAEGEGIGDPGVRHSGVRDSGVRDSGVGESGVGGGGGAHEHVGAGAGAVAGAGVVGDGAAAGRRVVGDPVKALMHTHRELCERAVDPLEIAAGLEAHGVTDRTAAHFRHRDVFSLAEEMYARVPRAGDTPPCAAVPELPRARAGWIVLTLLPGLLCAAAVAGLRLTQGPPRLLTAAAGVLAVALALRAAFRTGPPNGAGHAGAGASSLGPRTWWLAGYALLGDGLLSTAVAGGPDGPPTGTADGPWPVAVAPVMALALACAPAAWCARLFAVRARRRLAASRGLEEFAVSVRPLLLGTLALFLGALTVLLAVCGAVLDQSAAYPQALTLGALLLLARLLVTHGFPHAPAALLTAAASAQATALASVFAGRLPGCDILAAPVDGLVTAWGPAALPTLICGAGAATLLIHAMHTLTKASSHASAEGPW